MTDPVRNDELGRYDLITLFDFCRGDHNTVALVFANLSSTRSRSMDKLIKLELVEQFGDHNHMIRLTEKGKGVVDATVGYFQESSKKP